VENAGKIAQTCFFVSDIGLQGRGVYFSVYPPVKVIGFDLWPIHQWPEPSFKSEVLRLNYDDDGANESRQDKVNAVIIVKARNAITKEVADRPGAICISDTDYCHKRANYMIKDAIAKIVQLV